MKNTQTKTADEIQIFNALRNALSFFEDKSNIVYSSEFIDPDTGLVFTSTKDLLNSLHELGIEGKNLKEAGLNLEEWYETLKNQSEITTSTPEYVSNTTLTPEQLEYLEEQAEERNKQSKAAVESSNQRVRDFEKRNKEIYAEQQRIQNEIKEAEAAKEKLKGKVVYAKVILPEPLPLDEIEQRELEVLRNKAIKETPEPGKAVSPKVELINDLTIKIEEKIRSALPAASEEEIEIIAKTAAVEIVEKIAKPETAIELNIQTAIYSAINNDAQNVVETVVKKDDELLTAAKNGSTLSALKIRNDELTSKLLIENLFGPKLAIIINGYSPEQIRVELSESKIEGQSEYQIDLGRVQESRIQILQNQDRILNSIQDHGKKFGYDSIGNSFTSYARTYLAEKTAAMPAGSVIKKTYSDPIIQSILSKYGLANPVIWETTAQSGQFVSFLMRVSPDTAGPILNIAGRLSGSEYVTPIVSLSGGAIGAGLAAQTAATTASVTFTGGIMAGEAFAGGAGAAAAGAAAGSTIAPIIGTAIGAAVGALFGKAASAAKVWWTKNKDKIKPVLAVGATITAIRFFGIGPGLGIGAVATFGLMGTAGLATLATGAFGVLGFIGRSIGVAVATPVIVTLLVLPPLVAFIMLVINNSAYVVPPGLLGGKTENLYLSVTKTAEPSGPFENTALPLKIKYTIVVNAKKGALTDINFNHTCKVIKSGSIQDCQAPTEQPPSSIATSYTYTYEVTYNTTYNDSMVINKFCVSAKNTEGEEQESCGSATITIGKPPAECFVVDDSFGSKKSLVETAVFEKLVGEYSPYSAKVCASLEGRTIEFRYGHQYLDYWGWNHSNEYIEIFDLGLRNQDDTNYIVFHEVAHVMTFNNDQWYDEYKQFPNTLSEKPFCFYTYETITGEWPYEERFAESAAFYAFNPCGNFQQRYPASYKYMDEILFK